MTSGVDPVKNSKERHFPLLHKVVDGSAGPARRVHMIECSRCPKTEFVYDNGPLAMPSVVIRRKFAQKNWQVGAKYATDDMCPDCVDADRRKRSNLRVVQPLLAVPAQPPAIQGAKMPPAEAPQAMDADDRRLIFAKLNDVWAGKDVGYVVPWTDQAVAKELGVPMAWVSEVRAQFFGEAKDNSEIRELLEKVKAVNAQIEEKVKEAELLRKQGTDLIVRANTLNGSMIELRRSADYLANVAARIEKAIS